MIGEDEIMTKQCSEEISQKTCFRWQVPDNPKQPVATAAQIHTDRVVWQRLGNQQHTHQGGNIISYALLQHLTIPTLMLVLHPVDVVDVNVAFVQVLHTVPQQHLTTLVASPQHHAPATLSTGTRTIKVIYFSVITDLKSSLIVTFVA